VDNLEQSGDDLLAGYLPEKAMAASLRRNERTLQRWRKLQIGPPFTMIGDTPYYNIEAGRQWLAAGGTASQRRRGRGVAP
jgi:hypothetical protein